MTCTCTIDTPLGVMTAAAEDDGLIGLWFIGQRHYPLRTADWVCEPDRSVFMSLRAYLERYFSGDAAATDVRLVPHGSPFQKEVWDALLRIPMGQVTTYGEIARNLSPFGSASMSARAVGGAVGRNPISILIPCHRVVGSQGALTGYAGGLDKKTALLRIEKADLTAGPRGPKRSRR
jgi:methylated-DNA-[protein]-cysteine S-methyltransferase